MGICTKLPQLDNCCFCINLRTGGIILASLYLIFSSILLISVSILFGALGTIDKTDPGKYLLILILKKKTVIQFRLKNKIKNWIWTRNKVLVLRHKLFKRLNNYGQLGKTMLIKTGTKMSDKWDFFWPL